jgi:hypothetical protein
MVKTDVSLFHGGTPPEEIAAITSLALGIRLRAGYSSRRFEPGGDPMGHPTMWGLSNPPTLLRNDLRRSYVLPSATGSHALLSTNCFATLPTMSPRKCIALIRAARLYQDALWLVESETSLAWTMLVSALESAANDWRLEASGSVERLLISKPKLHAYLSEMKDKEVLPTVAELIGDTLGSTKKFVDFLVKYLPPPPAIRPPDGYKQNWDSSDLQKVFRQVYGYRSKALHEGTPFPAPMCEAPYCDPQWGAPGETIGALATGTLGAVWMKEDTPMNFHLFEYIARNALLSWWQNNDA